MKKFTSLLLTLAMLASLCVSAVIISRNPFTAWRTLSITVLPVSGRIWNAHGELMRSIGI